MQMVTIRPKQPKIFPSGFFRRQKDILKERQKDRLTDKPTNKLTDKLTDKMTYRISGGNLLAIMLTS